MVLDAIRLELCEADRDKGDWFFRDRDRRFSICARKLWEYAPWAVGEERVHATVYSHNPGDGALRLELQVRGGSLIVKRPWRLWAKRERVLPGLFYFVYDLCDQYGIRKYLWVKLEPVYA